MARLPLFLELSIPLACFHLCLQSYSHSFSATESSVRVRRELRIPAGWREEDGHSLKQRTHISKAICEAFHGRQRDPTVQISFTSLARPLFSSPFLCCSWAAGHASFLSNHSAWQSSQEPAAQSALDGLQRFTRERGHREHGTVTMLNGVFNRCRSLSTSSVSFYPSPWPQNAALLMHSPQHLQRRRRKARPVALLPETPHLCHSSACSPGSPASPGMKPVWE